MTVLEQTHAKGGRKSFFIIQNEFKGTDKQTFVAPNALIQMYYENQRKNVIKEC